MSKELYLKQMVEQLVSLNHNLGFLTNAIESLIEEEYEEEEIEE